MVPAPLVRLYLSHILVACVLTVCGGEGEGGGAMTNILRTEHVYLQVLSHHSVNAYINAAGNNNASK